MNRSDINRYIDKLMSDAQIKVRADCQKQKDDRILELIEVYELKSYTDRTRRTLEPVIASMDALITKMASTDGLKIERNYRVPLTSLHQLIGQLSPAVFLDNQFDLNSSDVVLNQIRALEKKSLQEVKNSYFSLKQNTWQLTPKKAMAYLKELGFVLPEEDDFKGLLKPLDTRFLLVKGAKEEEIDD